MLSNSPAIDAAQPGYPVLPDIVDLPIEGDVLFDLVQQARPELIAQKNVGGIEYPHAVAVAPIATEDYTGPSYETSSLRIDSDYLDAVETKPPKLFP